MTSIYANPDDAEDYFGAYGDVPAAWEAASSEEQLAASVVASRWMDQTYRGRWKGTRATSTQERDFPRSGMVDRDGYSMSSTTTPTAVREAMFEVALLHLQGELDSLPTSATTERIASKTISAEGVSKSVTYIGGSSTSTSAQRTFPKIEAMLADVLRDGGGTVDHWPAFS